MPSDPERPRGGWVMVTAEVKHGRYEMKVITIKMGVKTVVRSIFADGVSREHLQEDGTEGMPMRRLQQAWMKAGVQEVQYHVM